MTSKLDQLKSMTIVTADTGDIEAIRAYGPHDCTTNPTLILKAAQMEAYGALVEEAILWGINRNATASRIAQRLILWGINHNATASRIAQRLAVTFGAELTKLVPGRVSTEVDADLSFDVEGTVAQAREIIEDYVERGVRRDRVLVKIAATWEGIKAASILQKDGIDCNLTLIFSLAQAAACADAGVFLISPFIGRIYDWYQKTEGKSYTPETDPGIAAVKQIYAYYKAYDIKTVIMGASFRNLGQVEALAGCDSLTIAPALLDALRKIKALARKLDPATAAKDAPARMYLDEKSFRFHVE